MSITFISLLRVYSASDINRFFQFPRRHEHGRCRTGLPGSIPISGCRWWAGDSDPCMPQRWPQPRWLPVLNAPFLEIWLLYRALFLFTLGIVSSQNVFMLSDGASLGYNKYHRSIYQTWRGILLQTLLAWRRGKREYNPLNRVSKRTKKFKTHSRTTHDFRLTQKITACANYTWQS